ncbi:hypothetical protein HMPREF1551_01312 [Capnocytophaga sp. oral taxon 863 str. F0517]|nr:hypothetical protein [Capnocytophaga sp. oral taxon 863]ERI63330.1 hypothetical protein HMPREF1551_01312 [Capnocytophaga sp. oral taxon 863 str. F0517]
MQEADREQGKNFGVNIGSSLGATTLFEQYHKDFFRASVPLGFVYYFLR